MNATMHGQRAWASSVVQLQVGSNASSADKHKSALCADPRPPRKMPAVLVNPSRRGVSASQPSLGGQTGKSHLLPAGELS